MSKIGLCLSGGGARGAYQIGACQALEDLHIFQEISAFSGTSIGSVNASLVATMKPSEVREIWFSISPDLLKRTENTFKNIIKEKLEFKETGIYEIGELEKTLRNHLDLNKLKKSEVYITLSDGGEVNEGIFGLFRNSYQHYIKKDSKVIYAPLHEVSDDNLVFKEILASCSIPIVFAPTPLGGHQYYDGGVYDDVPVRPLIDAGCDTIIVVHLHRFHLFDKAKYPQITFHEIVSKQKLGGLLNFDPEQSKKIYEYGYSDTIKYFENNPIK